MKKLLLLTKTLLAVALLCVGQNAWSKDLPYTIGETTQNWETDGSYSDSYTLATGKTLTFTFTVNESAAAAEGDDWKGYVAVLQESATRHTLNTNTYSFVRSMCDYNVKGTWNTGAILNTNTYPSGAKYTHFVGADITMTIKRIGTYVEIKTAIAKDATTYYHHYVQDLGTSDDVYAFLCADWAQLTLKSAVIEDNTTMGSTESNWLTANSYSNYTTLAADKTLTYIFSINDSKKNSDSDGYCLDLQKSTDIHNVNNTESDYTYLFMTSGLWYYSAVGGGWNAGQTLNVNNYEVSKKEFFTGATVKMVVRRYGTEVIMTTEITKSGTTYTHSYVQDLNTTNDINAFLGADYAVLAMMEPIITNTDVSLSNPVSIPIGLLSHTEGWNVNYITAIPANGMYNMHFTNHTTGTNKWDCWSLRLKFNDGAEDHTHVLDAGDFWEDNYKFATAVKDNKNWPSTDADIVTKMNGADVTLTIARNANVVTVTAIHTPISGDPFVLKYTLSPSTTDYPTFATLPLDVEIVPRWSHVVMKYPNDMVNAEVSKYGWATFSSDYKLDFSGVSGLEAYAVTGHVGNVVTKSDALGIVAANAGVLLKGTEGTSSTYYNIPVSTGAAYDGTNLMVAGTGASVGTVSGKTRYVLGVSDGEEAEFQKIVSDAATVAKGKAYLEFDGVLARSMRFSGDITGVENVEAAPTEAKAKEGKFVENGKLVIVKNGVKYNAAGAKLY